MLPVIRRGAKQTASASNKTAHSKARVVKYLEEQTATLIERVRKGSLSGRNDSNNR